ncbi:proline-rich acidic protein 1 isoform X1 [Hyperolius riggenbachi]|uniref:proline-rich acidic protein 1 isoform X1 n=1 Tax=Hyperolius riggenbachi TaxID=752182 RepID=UPI0035A365F3
MDTLPDIPVPDLGKDDKYHVFISYSSGDSIWVSGLIFQLEKTFPSLKICFHERDFVPGKTILDNMVQCIQSSQKTLMVLSPDFVRSRWCLFEANLSMFQDCMLHKAIVPIMLKPCPVPLYLSHLTYLDADDEKFFDKLCHVLLNSNNEVAPSSLIHFQSSLLYSGKTLLTLTAVNEEGESWEPAIFSSAPVPDALKALVDNPRIYKDAIEIINDVSPPKSCIRHTAVKVILCIIYSLLASFFFVLYIALSITSWNINNSYPNLAFAVFLPIAVVAVFLIPTQFVKIACWKKRTIKKISEEMIKKTCEANLLLSDISVLVGYSRSQLFFVYVKLHDCMETFQISFGHDNVLATNMWKKSISAYSSEYACCLARKHFPSRSADPPGHLKEGICFCQYTAMKLKNRD